MKIYTYAICWNEEIRLKWYLEHYSFADKHIIYDNYSTDSTVKIAKANPKVTIKSFGKPNVLSNKAYLDIKNNCWKGCGADWVIIGDMDEFLYHPSLRDFLSKTDATILSPYVAYTLISEKTPKHYKEMNQGYIDPGYMKACLFKPSCVAEINYTPGCHKISPKGSNIVIGHGAELIMYHYSMIGFDYVVSRYAACDKRRSKEDIDKKWGTQFTHSKEHIRKHFDKHIAGARQVITW